MRRSPGDDDDKLVHGKNGTPDREIPEVAFALHNPIIGAYGRCQSPADSDDATKEEGGQGNSDTEVNAEKERI